LAYARNQEPHEGQSRERQLADNVRDLQRLVVEDLGRLLQASLDLLLVHRFLAALFAVFFAGARFAAFFAAVFFAAVFFAAVFFTVFFAVFFGGRALPPATPLLRKESAVRRKTPRSAVKGKSDENPSVARRRGKSKAYKARMAVVDARPECDKCGQRHRRCTAHNRRGDPCGQQPRVGMGVCRSHGGNAKQVRAKAEERLLAAQDDLMAALLRIALDEKVRVRDRLIAIRDALNLADLSKGKVRLEVSLWDQLGATAFQIERGSIDAIDPGAIDGAPSRPELPAGHDDEEVDEYTLNALRKANRDDLDRESYLDNDGATVIPGRVVASSPGVSGSAPPPWGR
jgi:hypothetical protein